VVDMLQGEAVRMIGLPATRERMAGLSYEPSGMTTEAFARLIDADIQRWAKMVKETGFKVTK